MSDPIPDDQSKKKPPKQLGCIATIVFCIALGVPVAGMLMMAVKGLPAWAAMPLGTVAVIVVLYLVAMTKSREARRQLSNFLRFLFRNIEALDWRAARIAAAGELVVQSQGPFTIWTDCDGGLPFDLELACDRVRAEYAALTGLPTPEISQLRVIAFRDSDSFRRYNGTLLGELDLAAYYLRTPVSRLVIGVEIGELASAAGVKPLFDQLLAYHLIFDHYRRVQVPWLHEGLANAVRDKLGDGYQAPGTLARLFLAETDRGTLFPATDLLTQRVADLFVDENQTRSSADTFAGLRRFVAQSALLVSYLASDRRREFTAFLDEKQSTKLTPESFEQTFGVSIEAAFETALKRLIEDHIPPYAAPPEEWSTRADAEWIPRLLNEETPPQFRRMLVRSFGSSGYPWRADVLIRLADDDLSDLQPDALYSIEQLAGTSFRRDRTAMYSWYAALAVDVKSPESVLSGAESKRLG